VTVRLRVEIPPSQWYGVFSRRHPELVFEIHNHLDLEDRQVLIEAEIFGTEDDLSDEFRRFPEVVSVERVSGPDEVGTYRLIIRNPLASRLGTDLHIVLRYPRVVRNGVVTSEAVARKGQVRQYVEGLRALGIPVRIVSLRRGSVRFSRPVLTKVQREMFRRAYALGYFDVPRRLSLTDLARELSRSKSHVSQTLAVVKRKLAEGASSLR
jgi:predicted DNA binding protein